MTSLPPVESKRIEWGTGPGGKRRISRLPSRSYRTIEPSRRPAASVPPVGVEIDSVAIHAVGDVEEFRGSRRVPDDEHDLSALLVLHGEVTAVAAESDHARHGAIAVAVQDRSPPGPALSDEHVAREACRRPCDP